MSVPEACQSLDDCQGCPDSELRKLRRMISAAISVGL